MPELKTDEYLNMAFTQHVAPENELDVYRNMFAIQGALVRGDVEVVLHNASTLNPAMKKRLRRLHPENTDHARREDIGFWQVGKDDRKLDGAGVSSMFEAVHWSGLRFEFVKILGAGSYGAATLWKVHLEGGVSEKVVIKLAVKKLSAAPSAAKTNFNPDEEAYWHRRYHGSRHTVQIMDLASLAATVQREFRESNPGKPLRYTGGVRFEPEDYDATVLEHMCHGDLFGILSKASFLGEEVTYMPDKVLWGIWECLVRGVAAVAYQPTFAKERDEVFEEELDRARQENRLGQFFNMLEKQKITHDVHFDLEETNILVGEASDHPNQPVFKLHDFGGFSCSMDKMWQKWTFRDYWRRRHLAKMTRLLPEQVHEDWDKIPTHEPWEEAVKEFQGEDLSVGHPIAGRYGSWSNMEAVMTLIYIAHPFSSKSHKTLDGSKTANTYGWRLKTNRFRSISAELRDIVCQCLFERPIDRPSIVALLRQIEMRKERGFGQTDAGVKEYWEMLLTPQPERPIPEPQPVAPSVPQRKTGWSHVMSQKPPTQMPSTLISTGQPQNHGAVDLGVQDIQQEQQRPWLAPEPPRAGPSRRSVGTRRAQRREPLAALQPSQAWRQQNTGPSSQYLAPGYAFQNPNPNDFNSRSSLHPPTWRPPGYPPMDPRMQNMAFNPPQYMPSANSYKHPQGPYPGIRGQQQQQQQVPRGADSFGTYRGMQYHQPQHAKQPPPPPPPVPSANPYKQSQGPYPGVQKQQKYQAPQGGTNLGTYRGMQYRQPPQRHPGPPGSQHPAPQQGTTNPFVQPGHPQDRDGRSGRETGYMMLNFAVPEYASSGDMSEPEGGVAAEGSSDANPIDQVRVSQQTDRNMGGRPRAGLPAIPEAGEPPLQPPRAVAKTTPTTRPQQQQVSKVSKKRAGKSQKSKRRPKRRPPAIAAYVERALPNMPVAIRNLWVRAKQLDERLQHSSVV